MKWWLLILAIAVVLGLMYVFDMFPAKVTGKLVMPLCAEVCSCFGEFNYPGGFRIYNFKYGLFADDEFPRCIIKYNCKIECR